MESNAYGASGNVPKNNAVMKLLNSLNAPDSVMDLGLAFDVRENNKLVAGLNSLELPADRTTISVGDRMTVGNAIGKVKSIALDVGDNITSLVVAVDLPGVENPLDITFNDVTFDEHTTLLKA